jgi:hypothetical protein
MKTRSLAAAVAALLLGPITAWAIPSVVFTPSAATVNTGDTLAITVGVTGLAAGGLPLSDYDLAVSFDPSLMSLATSPYTLDPAVVTYLGGGNAGNVLGSQPTGTNYLEDQTTSLLTSFVDLTAAQSPGGVPVDGFNLFKVTFDVLGTLGTGAAANFSLATLSSTYPYSPTLDVQEDANYDITTYHPSASLCVNVNDPTACSGQVPAVPEPATYSLVLLGLLAGGVVGQKARFSAKTKA